MGPVEGVVQRSIAAFGGQLKGERGRRGRDAISRTGTPCYGLVMTRTEAIAKISEKLASFDDERVQTVAEIVVEMDELSATPIRALSERESTLLAQSKADFAAGRSYSHEEAIEMLDDLLAPLGVPRSRP
jgi:hypothetical protein